MKSMSVIGVCATLFSAAEARACDMFGYAVDCRPATKKSPELVLIGDPIDSDTYPPKRGRVWLIAPGSDAKPVSVIGKDRGDELGCSVALLDDYDGDGVCDFAAVAPCRQHFTKDGDQGLQSSSTGYIQWFSGKTGALLHELAVPVFSNSVPQLIGIEDVDGDGKRDLLVGVPAEDGKHKQSGVVKILSSKDYSAVISLSGESTNAQLGAVVASLGDIDGYGVPDCAATSFPGVRGWWMEPPASLLPSSGKIVIGSGKDGHAIRSLTSQAPGLLGGAIAGSVRFAPHGPFALLTSLEDPKSSGQVMAYSISDGSLMRSWKGKTLGFGRQLCVVGDMNGDGIEEVVIGESGYSKILNDPTIWIKSGKDDSTLRILDGTETDDVLYPQMTLRPIGDHDADGTPDVLIAAAPLHGWTNNNWGSVGIFSGKTSKLLKHWTRTMLTGEERW